MRPPRVERVPAHVRNLQARIGRRDAVDLARDPAEPLDHLVFAAALGHQLHADADAEERPAARAHALVERVHHAADGVEAAPAIREGADAGQHHAVGAGDLVGIARHHDRLRRAHFARGALERLGRRMQIARSVVDDGDGHRDAPGSGNRPMTSDDPGACGDACSDPCGRRRIGTADVDDAAWRGSMSCRGLPTQASKNRRSAASRSSPTTMPTFFQRAARERKATQASPPRGRPATRPGS